MSNTEGVAPRRTKTRYMLLRQLASGLEQEDRAMLAKACCQESADLADYPFAWNRAMAAIDEATKSKDGR